MARYIIKDGVKFDADNNLLNNSSFREDMKIALTFLGIGAFAFFYGYLTKQNIKKQEKRQQIESVQENKIIDVKNAFDATHLFKLKQR